MWQLCASEVHTQPLPRRPGPHVGVAADERHKCDATPRYGLLLDDPRVTTPNDCRYEACIPLPRILADLPPGFSVKRIPYGAYAQERHVGGKVGIARTISKIRSEWMSDNGLVSDSDRPMIEIYLDDPSTVPVEHQRIDVCLPVMFPADPNP